ncbi:CHAT domain-containing protein [Streptomyces sp. NBS 14/10]|uniref:CHAT domain-containing protein n=1 Tax=Streptomyces sp. NBS 14/10 TaxID=1945643 RepID=UPI000B7D5FFF|nr:CHAT domain-containing protein [Streptomyces sp.]
MLADPTREKVLEALHGHQIAHFACQALADETDPGRSRLILPDHARALLTVTDISNLHLNVALAYLAASETRVTAAFQLAGYRHVVGTLWSIDDRAAIELAMDLYGHLAETGTNPSPGRAERPRPALCHAAPCGTGIPAPPRCGQRTPIRVRERRPSSPSVATNRSDIACASARSRAPFQVIWFATQAVTSGDQIV